MPIVGPSSFLPTTDLFLSHWAQANSALPPASPIVLANGVTLATLTTLRTTLASQRAGVEAARNTREGARADIELLKAALLDRLNQFNGKLASLVPDSRWTAQLPKAFSITEGIGKVLSPLDDVYHIWSFYQDATGTTITLRDDYNRGLFEADLDQLKAFYTAYSAAEVGLGLARGERNETQDAIYAILKQYRQRIPSEFAEGSAIFETLPRLTPLPGSTPEPAALSGAYNTVTESADLSWALPDDPSIVEVELRATVGPEFDDEDESTVATFPVLGPTVWSGTFGLLVPGAESSFKIFTKTAEGNEKGSNPVTVKRPFG